MTATAAPYNPPTPAEPPTAATAHHAELDVPPHLFLYDGVCGLCNKAVQLLLKLDTQGIFYFAPLQGETTQALRRQHDTIPAALETIVYIEEGQVYLRSKAILMASRHLSFPWSLGYALRWIPSALTDLGYRFIASIRYKVFGKYDSCRIPSPDERSRFLP
ncbi:MAG: DCC1-like thiol-disulfide oxidoreductase family protein [Myxococcota bacterium]